MSHAISFLRVVVAVVVVVFALIGFLYVTRGGAVKRVRGVGVTSGTVSPVDPEFALSVAMATGAFLLPNNHVEIAENGDGTFSRLWEDLRSAQHSIAIQMYYGLPGRVADTLAEILIDRARNGVRVLGLYDAFGTGRISALDNRSLVLNEEVTLMVLDAGFGHDMTSMFLDDLRHATEITPEEFRKRSWTERVVERGANVIARVL